MKTANHFPIVHLRLLHSLQIVVACAITCAIIYFSKVPHSGWSLVTVIVLMGPATYLGGIMTRVKQRIIGTLIGAMMGLSLFLLPRDPLIFYYLLLLIYIGIAMYFVSGKYAYAALLVGITLGIISNDITIDHSLPDALWRSFNVIWPGFLAWGCSRFIFPVRASLHFRFQITQLLNEVGEFYLIHNREIHYLNDSFHRRTDKLSRLLIKQRQLLPLVEREWKGKYKNKLTQIVSLERRILVTMETLIETRWSEQLGYEKLHSMPEFDASKDQLGELIRRSAKQIHSGNAAFIPRGDIELLNILPDNLDSQQDKLALSDVSYLGYIWLNRELARLISDHSHMVYLLFSDQK